MTQIFLIRHGQAEGNIFRRVQGQSDSPLTAEGRRQISYLTPRFADIPLDAAYSSDLSRARETAEAAVGARNIPVRTDPRLREVCFGAWEGRAWGNVTRDEPEMKTLFFNDPARWSVPGGESFRDAQARICGALTNIAKRHEGGTVVAAAHGAIIRDFLAAVRGVPSEEISSVVLPPNASVTLLNWEDGAFHEIYAGDTSHLPEPPFIPVRKTLADGAGVKSWDLRYEPFDMDGGRERYLACYRDAWRTAHGSLQGFDAAACWRGAQLRAEESPGSLQAAYLEDAFAGVLALDEKRGARSGIGWIAFLYILPEYRGHGCGVQLVGEARHRYHALGRTRLQLTVAPSNPALGFYRHCGFSEAGTAPGAVEPLLIMERPI